jgi:hypothetical protein
MLGEIVTHTRFGRGTVTAFNPPRMEVAFDDGATRAFAYPQAVERFICFESPDAMERASRDRQQAEVLKKESDLARLLESRRRAEEDNQRRLDAIREKKVAAAKRTAARSAMARKMKVKEE